MTLGEYVGLRARELRRARGLTQRDVERATSIRRPNISRLEHGVHDPSLDIMRRVSEALGCTVADLVAGWEDAHDPG